MPMLDVSWVTMDPMLADTFDVTRRLDVVSTANGRTTPTQLSYFPGIVGVVTQQSPNDLLRKEEGQIVPRRIFIASMFQFYGASSDQYPAPLGYQPDLVKWNGTTYVVSAVMSYGRFGAGIWEVVCDSMTAVDVPQ